MENCVISIPVIVDTIQHTYWTWGQYPTPPP